MPKRSSWIILAETILVGCFATHEPPPIEFSSPIQPLPLAVAAEYEPPEGRGELSPELQQDLRQTDDEIRDSFIEDLRATGLFRTVNATHELTEAPDLIATRLPFHIDSSSYCGESTVSFFILTGGLIPVRLCQPGYAIRFSTPNASKSIEFTSKYEADTWVGWIPLMMNVDEDWHWYGPPSESRRLDYLRHDLNLMRGELLRLARERR